MAFGNLTVDFKQLSRIPVRDRMALAQSPQASQIFGNLTPSQIAALFPDYYKRALNPMAGQVSGFAAALSGATSVGTGSSSNSTASTSTGTTTAANSPLPSAPTRPGFINDIMSGVTAPVTPLTGGNIRDATSVNERYKKSRISGLSQQQQLMFAAFVSANFEGGPHQQGRVDTLISMMNRAKQNHSNYGDLFNQLSAKEQYSPISASIYGTSADPHALGVAGRRVTLDQIKQAVGSSDPIAALSELYGRGDKGANAARQVLNSAITQDEYYQKAREWVGGRTDYRAYRKHASDIERKDSDNAFRIANAEKDAADITDFLAPDTETGLASATAPITGEAPQGSDVSVGNLQGTPADASVKVVPAPQGTAKTMLLSLGTNDFADPKNTYQNTLDAINEGRKKGYNVVVVPPVGTNDRFKAAYDEVMRAVNETGAPVEQPQSYSSDGYHPTGEEYRRIGEKYQGAIVVGDSIAVGIGQNVDNGQTLATEGIRTDSILARVKSQDVMQLETAQVTAVPSTFNSSVFAQLDPRIKEEYDKASDELKRQIETAIAQKGVAGINKIMEKYPMSTATAVSASIDEVGANVIERQQEVAGVRRGRITSELKQSMSYAAEIASDDKYQVILDVTSGGQRMEGAEGATGSHRHDEGGAADFNGLLVDRKTNERILLDPRKDEHRPYIQKLTTSFARVHPSAGVGALYMDDPTKIHFGGDDVSEHGGRARGPLAYDGPDWFREAHGQGVQQREQDLKEGRDVAKEWLQKKLEAQTAQVVQPEAGQPLPGAEAQTATPPTDTTTGGDVPIINTEGSPAQQTANATPTMKLGGSEEIKEPNSVNESMSLVSNGKEVAKFNKNEEVNVADGKINVQNEYQKKTGDTQQKTNKGTQQSQQNTGSMKSVPSTDVLRKIPDGYSPTSPSVARAFASIKSDRHWEKGLMS